MKRIAQTLVFAAALLVAVPGVAQIRIGIADYAMAGVNRELIELTVEAIRKALPDEQVTEYRLSEDQLRNALERQSLELFIASSGFFRQTMLASGASSLVTAVSTRASDPNHSEGSLILVRQEETALQRISDLRGRRVLFSSGFGFSGLAPVLGEIPAGENPKRWFGQLEDGAPDLAKLLMRLEGSEVDALILPTCLLEWTGENTSFEASAFRALEARLSQTLACSHSTALYPNLTLAALPLIAPEATRTIIRTLLMLPSNGHTTLNWGFATDFSQVDDLLRRLQIDEISVLTREGMLALVRKNWHWLVLLLLAIAGLGLHSIVLKILVRRRTDELTRAIAEREALFEKEKSTAQRLEKMQKLGVIGQMSSLFAHEIRQPLSAIQCWSYAARKVLEGDPQAQAAKAVALISRIEEQVHRAEGIVSRVRNYVKSKSRAHSRENLADLMDRAVASFRTTSMGVVPVIWTERAAELFVQADAFELELAFINLLRNSVEAQVAVAHPQIRLALVREGDCAVASVQDNGPALEEKALQSMQDYFFTSKPDGLGLGLSIVRSIAAEHEGSLELSASAAGGLMAVIRLPLVLGDKANG